MLVKICGVTTVDDARAVADASAEFLGLNFHPPSRRFITESRAAEIVAVLPPRTRAVGVFANRAPDQIIRLARETPFFLAQLHGNEPPADIHALNRAGLETIKAFRVGDDASLLAMSQWLVSADAIDALPAWVLIDADAAGHLGGSGQTIPAHALSRVRAFHHTLGTPPPAIRSLLNDRLILAGGLTPENVASIVRQIQPAAVDVASGVESTPPRKDVDRLIRFIAAARA